MFFSFTISTCFYKVLSISSVCHVSLKWVWSITFTSTFYIAIITSSYTFFLNVKVIPSGGSTVAECFHHHPNGRGLYQKYYPSYYKTSYLNEEVKSTQPYPSVSIKCYSCMHQLHPTAQSYPLLP
jgi:hypothetical protein